MNDIPIEIRLRAAYLQGAMEALMGVVKLGMQDATTRQIADHVTRRCEELAAESDGMVKMITEEQPRN